MFLCHPGISVWVLAAARCGRRNLFKPAFANVPSAAVYSNPYDERITFPRATRRARTGTEVTLIRLPDDRSMPAITVCILVPCKEPQVQPPSTARIGALPFLGLIGLPHVQTVGRVRQGADPFIQPVECFSCAVCGEGNGFRGRRRSGRFGNVNDFCRLSCW